MDAFVHVEILPSQPTPLIKIMDGGARVPPSGAIPFPLPAQAPVDSHALWWALPEQARQALDHLHRLQHDRPIPLWIDVRVPEVAAWRWELLAPGDQPGLTPFACLPHTPLVRAHPARLLAPTTHLGPLRLLAITATPHDGPQLDPQPVLDTLYCLHDPARIRVSFSEHVGARDLPALMADAQPDLLLLLCPDEPGALLLEDERGAAVALPASALADILAERPGCVVVLAGCHSAALDTGGRSTAAALLDGGALAVVSLSDVAESSAFLLGFIDGLARGESVEVAVASGRQQVVAALGARAEWELPVCWQRALDRPLVLAPPQAFRQGARLLAEKAPSWGTQLATGGWLGLLAVCSLQALLLPSALPVPAVVGLLRELGLGVTAGYLEEALGEVWRRSGRQPAPEAAPQDVAQALVRVAAQRADAAVEIAQAARDSGALQQTLDIIGSGGDGSAELLAGLVRDSRLHGLALVNLLSDLHDGLRLVYLLALQAQGDTHAIRERTVELLRLYHDDRDALREQARGLARERGRRRAQEQILLRGYLAALGESCNRLAISDAGPVGRAGVGLDSIYVDLEVARTTPTEEADILRPGQPERHITALAALAAQPRLVLLGAPGAGKSTFISFLARCLAQATLTRDRRWLDRLGAEWAHGPLIPIAVSLRDFAAWLSSHAQRGARGSAGLVWRFLSGQHSGDLAAYLQRQAQSGRALLLLDGLDEAGADASGWPLDPVRESIVALAGSLGPGGRMIVTCRTADYQPQRRLSGWPEETLRPLSGAAQDAIIHNWHAALVRLHRPISDAPDALERRLRQQIRARPDLRRLSGSPLLLTMITLIHAAKGRLPEERVRLYAECIEFLLGRWRDRPDGPSLRERLDLPQWSETNLLELLELLGHAAHLRSFGGSDDSSADLPYDLLIRAAESYFKSYGQGSYRRAEEFAAYAGQADGILQVHEQSGGDRPTYRFPHRAIQEYLAGRALINDALRLADEPSSAERDLVARALRYAEAGPHWHDALLLAASQHALNGRSREVADLARALLPRDPSAPLSADQARRIILASELLLEVGRARIMRLGEQRAPVWTQARDQLLRLLPYPPSALPPPLPPVERARAGLVLAQIGDPRPGVCTLRPDWCGPFPVGEYPLGGGQASVRLGDFRISRYPATVWQYRRFVESGGYEQERWWTPEGWRWLQSSGGASGPLRQPAFWDQPHLSADNQPATGISWYEAAAFCRWLTARGHEQGWLRPGEQVRLPTEAEWEAAAVWDPQIGQMRPRPDFGREDRLAGAALDAPPPVGIFPRSVSPSGVVDMVGTVGEWCASDYKDYPPQAADLRDDFAPEEFGPTVRGQQAPDAPGPAAGGRAPNFPSTQLFGLRVALAGLHARAAGDRPAVGER